MVAFDAFVQEFFLAGPRLPAVQGTNVTHSFGNVGQGKHMNWTADSIRHLRYRMGWSRAEMARCVGCNMQHVLDWETGGGLPESGHRNTLLHFFRQAESNAERIMRRPVAERLMEDRNLAQIHDTEVVDCLATGVLSGFTFTP